MRSKTITELTEMTTPPAADDLLVIYDVSAQETKKIKPSNLGTGGFRKLVTASVIDDMNTEFVFTERPTELNINGGLYGEGDGVFAWTWSEIDLKATLAIPVGTAGFIHGVV
jgi:hypothetical protein